MLAIVSDDQNLTWPEFEDLQNEIADKIRGLKLPSGTRVLLNLHNSPALFTYLSALQKLNIVLVLVDPKTPQKSYDFIVATTTPSVIVDHANWKNPSHISSSSVDPPHTTSNDVRYLMFSSGSTGNPKGVPLNIAQIEASQRNMRRMFSPESGHRELLLSPATHMDGLQRALMTLQAKGTLHLVERPLTPSGLIERIQRFQIQGLYLPPAIVGLFAESLDQDLPSSLRHIEVGSAAHTPLVLAKLQNHLATKNLVVHYGLTESSRATLFNLQEQPEKIDTVGRTQNELEIEIVDESFRALPTGQVGMIRLRGGQTASMYWNDQYPERFQDGWFATHDYGSLDSDGFLKFKGRKDDLLTRSGYHIFPAEIEATIGALAGVQEYSLMGIPHPSNPGNDELVFVCVATSKSETDLQIEIANRLPDYLRPNRIVFTGHLPRTPSGKVDRKRLREIVG